MAYDEEFNPAAEEEEAQDGIVLFGTAISPQILAVIIALAGLAGSVWLALNVVKPLWEQRAQLRREIAEKETQLDAQGNIQQQIEQAQAEKDEVQTVQQDVLSMFASPESLDTLLLDINQQVNQRNANLAPNEIRSRLVAQGCPRSVLENYAELDRSVNGFFTEATLTQFTPVFPDGASSQSNAASITDDGYELVQDNSFGEDANQQLKRQTYEVTMRGNFNQTRTVLRQIEQLQPLLVVKDFQAEQEQGTFLFDENGVLQNCQPEAKIDTSFTLEALLPLSQEELQQLLQQEAEGEEGEEGEEDAAE